MTKYRAASVAFIGLTGICVLATGCRERKEKVVVLEQRPAHAVIVQPAPPPVIVERHPRPVIVQPAPRPVIVERRPRAVMVRPAPRPVIVERHRSGHGARPVRKGPPPSRTEQDQDN